MTFVAQGRTKPFVFVHGAWHGGWCWRRVVPLLRRAGHEVFTPSLTGLGDRAHLSRPEINLDTHIVVLPGIREMVCITTGQEDITVNTEYTAVIKQKGDWWIGWIEEFPGVNCPEHSRDELIEKLRTTWSGVPPVK